MEESFVEMDCTLLGKHETSYDVFPSACGYVLGWEYTEEWRQSPYVGQHQQGIPFTHPLKRIKMEDHAIMTS